jgi:CelD/BcsL family acetyltransferase involved in cellulose biosynthesis
MSRVQIVTDEQELLRLAPAWNDLFVRADRPFLSQSFEWAWCVWKHLLSGGRLRCIFVWDRDRLVLIWAAAIVRTHRLWAAEVPIVSGGDYVDFLAEKSPEAEDWAALAWGNRSTNVDLTLLSRVRISSLLYRVLTERAMAPSQRTPARYVDWDQFANWAAYYKSLSERQSIARRQKKLSERGKVSFRIVEELDELRDLSAWVFRHKQAWLAAKGLTSPWVGSSRYERFLFSLFSEVKQYGHIAGFVLLLDDRTIAVKICVLGMSHLISLHDAYDEEFRSFSPQHILTISVIEWAYERRLTVDFCFGAEPYKKVFLPLDCPVADYVILNSSFGRLYQLLRSTIDGRIGALLKNAMRRIRTLRRNRTAA